MVDQVIRLLTALLLGAFCSWAYFVYFPSEFGHVYHVQNVQSNYQNKNENSQTKLSVFLKGDSGHVKTVVCQFAPQTNITEGTLKKVKVKGESEKFMFEKQAYYCDKYE